MRRAQLGAAQILLAAAGMQLGVDAGCVGLGGPAPGLGGRIAGRLELGAKVADLSAELADGLPARQHRFSPELGERRASGGNRVGGVRLETVWSLGGRGCDPASLYDRRPPGHGQLTVASAP